MTKRLIIRVRGLVQGVFYRHGAAEEARRLGITGVASNEGDGSVLIEAQGDEKALERFVRWCRKGPDSAHVERLEAGEAPPLDGESGFLIQW